MYVGRDFDPSDVGESEVYSFDFVKDMATGETIVSAEWFCTVAENSEVEDADSQDHVALSPTNSGTVTSQRITGLINLVKYVLMARVVTSLGNTKSLWAHVLVGIPK